ncbi:MAG: SPOR domain-containing protein [Betaproteobacteria bacterium]|nr:SPOR domain-containing protein [Betaproteobacteria bacterium]
MGKFDQTSRAATKPRTVHRKSGGGTLLGIFIGLVIGVLIAFGVVLYLNKSPLPFQNKYEGAPKAGNGGTTAQTPAPLPGKAGDKPAGRFEFYDILEGKHPATPGTAAPGTAAPRVAPPGVAPPAAGIVTPGVEARPAPVTIYFLQVGAFQKPADADNLKAKLALTGLDASVQEVTIPDKGIMHRVRVGPFRDPDEMNRARTQLSQAGIQGTVIKQTE